MLGQGRDQGRQQAPDGQGAGEDAAAALGTLWRSLRSAPSSPRRLHLRFERGRRAEEAAGQVAVLVSWEARRILAGEAQALVVLSEREAGELKLACAAYGLRYVDNS